MNDIIYLDNSSTTKPCKKCVEYLNNALTDSWGNPSSLHTMGIAAEEMVDNARNAVASVISASADEIFFTGSGTEANNTAIRCCAEAKKRIAKKIITTSIEHPSVLETIKSLESSGFEAVYLKPDQNGTVSTDKISNAIDKNTALVSIMLVNNEIGSIQNISATKEAINACGSPAVLHCDAVQAFGKMPINVKKLGVDLLSASGHKIHGPKGIGFLYKRKGLTLPPFITGGGQEKGFRSGTEPAPNIAGLLGAITELKENPDADNRVKEIRDYAKERLSKFENTVINSSDDALPYILNFSFLGYRSETLLHFLDGNGIFVSSGSACAKGKGSYVLNELGLDRKRTDSALRLSFSRYNTKEDIDKLAEALSAAAKFLRKA